MGKQDLIVNHEKARRFELQIGDDTAYIQYRIRQGILALDYIFVPVASRGKGYSGQLIQYAFHFGRENHLQMEVNCSYIARYLQSHP